MKQTAILSGAREENSALPPDAAVYGLKELAKRAGVSAEFFNAWRIEFDDAGFVNVFVDGRTRKRIRFPRVSIDFWCDLQAGVFHTSTAKWMRVPKALEAFVPDFKIPFSSAVRKEIGPLFSIVDEDCVACPVDLPASVLLTLARFEETLPGPRDIHGRFSAFTSVAWRDDFLHRPIVDEYGLALAEALSFLLPGWEPRKCGLRVSLGHDVDEIGTPFSLRTTMAHTLRRGRPTATARDLVSICSGAETTYQWLLRQLVQAALERGLRPAVYWKAAGTRLHGTGYDPRDWRIQRLISSFRTSGLEAGGHFSYDSFDSRERFCEEVIALQKLLGKRRLGGRQDFLRWSPTTWVQWDSEGLAYDASVGFADHIGFRAGTSYPFHPWLLSESREADLLEIPLLATDSTLFGYMRLSPEQALSRLLDCVARCRVVGGVFTVVWHNTTMLRRACALTYQKLLDQLSGSDSFSCGDSGEGNYWI